MTEQVLTRADGARVPTVDVDDASARPVSFTAGGATLRGYLVDAGATSGVAVRALDAVAAAACCGPGECEPGVAAGDAVPVLLLGVPSWTGGWVTEVEGSGGDAVVTDVVDRALAHAAAAGARVVAAGCTERGGGERIEARLVERGATAWQYAHEDYVTFDGPAEAYLGSLPPAVLRRRARDLDSAAEAGIVIRPIDAAEVARNLARLDALSATAGGSVPHAAGGHADGELWWGAFRDGDLHGYCTALPAGDTLWLGSRGFAADATGFNTGAYFALTHHVVVDAAADGGYRRVEFGGGSHYARIVRGCASRPVRSATLDPEVS